MSEASKSFVASDKHNKLGPDYFSFYTSEVAELLSQDDNSLLSSQTCESSKQRFEEARGTTRPIHDISGKNPSSSTYEPLFSNGLGASLSIVKKEKLKALLKQSLSVLTQEVDEVLHPVLAMQNLQSQLKRKRCQSSNSVAASNGDADQLSHKKLKDKAMKSDASACCSICSTTDPKSLCSSCRNKYVDGAEPLAGSKHVSEQVSSEVDNDLQYLLENDNMYVEEMVKKYSDEYLTTLDHMEKQLEEILDTVVSTCRSMTLGEKQHLLKQIQKLPLKNLDRVAEIIQSKKPSITESCKDIYVDLEKEDNPTLWRLHYYVEAVESAKKLAL